jgi:hypothetical protein
MEFFGDRERDAEPREMLDAIAAELARAANLPPGPVRHGALVASLVRAGQLAQVLGDAGDHAGGAAAEAAHASMLATTRIARGVWRSWRHGGRVRPPRPDIAEPVRSRAGSGAMRMRRPEGYGLYALYPEQYAVAARDLAGERRLVVVGIRSIGTSLAAMVAAGAGAPATPLTVRPHGHPYARRLAPSPELREAARTPGAVFAIVDEGPGLSGSSFAAVAEALLADGVSPDRVHLFAGHGGPPGVHATAEVRAVFERLPRHFVPLEHLLLEPGPLSLPRIAEDVIGPVRVVDDLTGGRWRRWSFREESRWPPSEGWLERRKLLLEGAGGVRWLAKFAGLGDEASRKLARAHALAATGAGIAPAALRHGFLFERWQDGATPLGAGGVRRPALLDAVRRVLRLSAARPRPARDGAPASKLAAMARVNAAESLGAASGEAARRLEDLLPEVERQARTVEVDGKMQAWEWLALPDGRLVKTDALDHHAAHDQVGCQDVLWDVAGAQLELGLSEGEALRLADDARAVSPGADPALLPFYRVCYLALEVGRWWFAAAGETPGAERGRREAALARYRRALGRALVALPRPSRRAGRTVAVAAADGGAADG